MIPLTKVSIEHVLFVEDDSIRKLFCFGAFIGFLTVQIFQKVLFNLILLDVQTFDSHPSPVQFPTSKFQAKTQHL